MDEQDRERTLRTAQENGWFDGQGKTLIHITYEHPKGSSSPGGISRSENRRRNQEYMGDRTEELKSLGIENPTSLSLLPYASAQMTLDQFKQLLENKAYIKDIVSIYPDSGKDEVELLDQQRASR